MHIKYEIVNTHTINLTPGSRSTIKGDRLYIFGQRS